MWFTVVTGTPSPDGVDPHTVAPANPMHAASVLAFVWQEVRNMGKDKLNHKCMLRGGNWYTFARWCRSAYRSAYGPGYNDYNRLSLSEE